MAQSPALSSSLESGWTSNATESVGGTPDFYLRHSHDLSVTGQAGPLALRTGLQFEREVFRHHTGENDLSITAGAEATHAFAKDMSLRLGYAMTQDWTGEMVDLGPLTITIRSPATEHEMLAELVVAGADRRVSVGVEALARRPGPSAFEGLDINPVQIEPEVLQIKARIEGEWVVTPQLAGLTQLEWITTHVPALDRAAFGREPARIARVATGLRLGQGGLNAQLRGGLDLVWPEAAPHLLLRLPFVEADAALALNEHLSLTARVQAITALFNPVDGVASRLLEGELGLRLALAEAVTLTGGASWSREQGLFDETVTINQNGIRAGLAFLLAPNVEAGLVATHDNYDDNDGAYSVRSIGMTLSGKV